LLRTERYQIILTDSGPETISQVLSGKLAAVIIFLRKTGDRELEYVPCLNRSDQTLPIIVISEYDSLKLQREVRKHRVFYYSPQPLHTDEIRAVLRDAVATAVRKR
jgi:DNA-binding NtrC family response regulator